MTPRLEEIAGCLAGMGGLAEPLSAELEGGVLRVVVRRGSGAGCPTYLDEALQAVARERLLLGLPEVARAVEAGALVDLVVEVV